MDPFWTPIWTLLEGSEQGIQPLVIWWAHGPHTPTVRPFGDTEMGGDVHQITSCHRYPSGGVPKRSDLGYRLSGKSITVRVTKSGVGSRGYPDMDPFWTPFGPPFGGS